MSQIEEIKNSLSIVDVVSDTVKLRRTGKFYTGFCPFHANTHTPAFVVFPDSGTWRCFGACAEGGDIFSFIMKRDNLDFRQAAELLAARAGVKLEKFQGDSAESAERREKRDRLRELLEDVANIYHDQLVRHPAGNAAREFLIKRGVTDATRDDWKLGYALDGWDAMTQHLLSSGYSREELIEAGVVSEQRDANGGPIPNGRIYDRFRNRLMIPIRDTNGSMSGFGARILNPNDVPKFLNSPQTILFDKGKTLFGYDRAKAAIRERDQSVIVEGYFDVIILHQAGFTNTVAPMGTALGPSQVRLLTRQSKRILMALDADAAGDSATMKGIDVIRETVKSEEADEETANRPDDRALLRQENALRADIRVTQIPEGQDPDEVVLRDPAEWQSILDHAKPIVTFRMETAAKGKDLHDAKAKSEIAAAVLPLIREVANQIERETYLKQLAAFLQVDERTLVRAAAQAQKRAAENLRSRDAFRRSAAIQPAQLSADPRKGIEIKEKTLLRFMLLGFADYRTLSAVDYALRTVKLDEVSRSDFENPILRDIADLYFRSMEPNVETATIEFMDERISDESRSTYQELLNDKETEDVKPNDLWVETLRLVGNLRKERINYYKKELGETLGGISADAEAKTEIMAQIAALNRTAARIDALIGKLNRNELDELRNEPRR